MEICAVFVLLFLFLFACSLANFLNQLPNCKKATRDAIERTVVDMGYFIHFRRHTQPAYNQDAVPGIVVVVLIVYSLTNVVLHLPNSTTAAIDWIVLELVYPFKLNTNLQTLRNRIHTLRENIDDHKRVIEEDLNDFEEPNAKLLADEWVSRMVTLLEEGGQLSDEAAHTVNHWFKGWSGSRYRLSKRVEVFIPWIDNLLDCRLTPCGFFARDVISSIDKISYALPGYYLHFNTHVETLRGKLQYLQGLLNNIPSPLCVQISEEETRKWISSLEAAKNDAMLLIQEVEGIHKYWFLPGSRYRLGKRIVKMISHVDEVSHAFGPDILMLVEQQKSPVLRFLASLE